MSPHLFTVFFLIALGSTLLVKTGLMLRQIRHVRAHRDAVPTAFADSIGLDAHQRAADYTAERMQLSLIELATSAVFVLALTLGGGLQFISTICAGLFDAGSIAHGVALLASLGVISWLIDLPFSLYRTFVLEKRYNFNRMTPALFISDSLKQTALAVVIGLPLLTGVLWLMAAMGAAWWVWVWAVWLGVNLLVLLIWPTFIAPLFNRFSPLADEQLKHRVESLLERCGFRSKGLFVMDGSRRSAHGNAYFTGFGASKRIVFFDTLLDKLTPQEVEAVLAHELGHFHHKHIIKRLLVLAPASLALFALLGWLLSQQAFFNGLGVTQTGTAAGLALFFLALPWFTFALTPLMSQWSRRHEFEADRYAASHTQANDLVSALVKLYRDNASTLTPDPVYSGFFDSHPPAAVRIARLQG
ncbi:MAG: M48 family metallopeptidase [Azoarcus sp.]|jgi:STE24 endopeptidase|nr:M48 family metallopeptidase [Azoarcus sp.]MDX9836783.1 M48 family metallopeptidase [Azoarcus sp.]